MAPQAFSCGIDYSTIPDLSTGLQNLANSMYHFACFPIVHPRFRRDFGAGKPTEHAFTRPDMLLSPMDWNVRVVGKLSPYLDVDSKIPHIRQKHEDAMVEELNFMRGLGLPGMMTTLKGPDNNNLARIILSFYNSSPSSSIFWVQVSMEEPIPRYSRSAPSSSGTWRWWSRLHRALEWDRRVGVALCLSAELLEERQLARWLGEPVRCLVIPTHVFSTNRKGFPILSKPHQEFVKKLMDRDVQVCVSGACRHGDIVFYFQYLQHLWDNRSTHDTLTCFAKGWEDFLQTPLQPLSDNLDSHTYNVFEKDPVKYDCYQRAVVAALRARYVYPYKPKSETAINNIILVDKDSTTQTTTLTKGENSSDFKLGHSGISTVSIPSKTSAGGASSSGGGDVDAKGPENGTGASVVQNGGDSKIEDRDLRYSAVIMVLGAGRGPLVRAVINAGTIAEVDVKVYAVEKNPTALIALYAQKHEIWGDQVEVVASDMRDFQPPSLADIIVSELLGSFGDNELSPECLDGARHLLKPDGISIPSSYTSYVCPVMSARLWGHVRSGEQGHCPPKPLHHQFETLWVVYLQNKYDIAPAQELFTFSHPGEGMQSDRRRYKSLDFPVSQSCTLHGFSGYFSCELYGGHRLSILPADHSPGMISWFPIFCPIRTPISLTEGDKIEANFWRCCGPRKVWYEWNITSPQILPIHNSTGRSSDMAL